MSSDLEGSFYVAASVTDAVKALAERGEAGMPLAGGTWIMRAPLRHEPENRAYVAIFGIDDLRRINVLDREISIGACVTHADLAASLATWPDLQGLSQAAGKSANPAVRNVATVGGNLCAAAFAASDLVPALLCLDAEVELEGPSGRERMPLQAFLRVRADLELGLLLRHVIVARADHRSAHIRLPLRKAGDYPVAIVSLAATANAHGLIEHVSIAVGSVEAVARRWSSLEADLVGRPLDPILMAERAEAHSGDFTGRDGVEAPGWYRVKVLPSLVRRAAEALQETA